MTLCAYIFAPIICLFIRKDGTLYLSWFGTPDAPAVGDTLWKQNHLDYSDYKLAVTWMWRNPAQVFDQILSIVVPTSADIKVYGNLNIRDGANPVGGWFFLEYKNAFQFAACIPVGSVCINMGAGWRLDPIVKKYESKTLGALIATPFRFYHQ